MVQVAPCDARFGILRKTGANPFKKEKRAILIDCVIPRAPTCVPKSSGGVGAAGRHPEINDGTTVVLPLKHVD